MKYLRTLCFCLMLGATGSLRAGGGTCDESFVSNKNNDISNAMPGLGHFHPKLGIQVVARDNAGKILRAKHRVLIDDAGAELYIIAEFNDWGKSFRPQDKFQRVAGSPYYETELSEIYHGMEYRLLLNGQQLLDPAAVTFTSPEYVQKYKDSAAVPYFNSIFWDHGRRDAYHIKYPSLNITNRPIVIAEADIFGLVRNWFYQNRQGPKTLADTYRFVTESGIINHLKEMGYNAIKFLPLNTAVDGDRWQYRYLNFGLYGPDSRYGTPDEFAMMIDAFHQEGIVFILDAVLSHFPKQDDISQGLRSINQIGLSAWKRSNGSFIYGSILSPWGSLRYDFSNPYVADFVIEGVLAMIKRYNIGGIRIDDADGLLTSQDPRGAGYLLIQSLVRRIREYKADFFIFAETYYEQPMLFVPVEKGGLGINYRANSNLFDFIRFNLQRPSPELDFGELLFAVRNSTRVGDSRRVSYITNHDEAANPREGATGFHVASLLKSSGHSWDMIACKTKVFGVLPFMVGSAYLDLPQLRLMQLGSFNSYHGIEINWSLENDPDHREVFLFFQDLSKIFLSADSFNQDNLDSNIVEHFDSSKKILILKRQDQAGQEPYWAVFNFSDQAFHEYRFGIEPGVATFKVILDSEDTKYGGNGHLSYLTVNNILQSDSIRSDAREQSLVIPFVAPWSVIIFKENTTGRVEKAPSAL